MSGEPDIAFSSMEGKWVVTAADGGRQWRFDARAAAVAKRDALRAAGGETPPAFAPPGRATAADFMPSPGRSAQKVDPTAGAVRTPQPRPVPKPPARPAPAADTPPCRSKRRAAR